MRFVVILKTETGIGLQEEQVVGTYRSFRAAERDAVAWNFPGKREAYVMPITAPEKSWGVL